MTGVFLHGSPTAADNAGMMQKTREDRNRQKTAQGLDKIMYSVIVVDGDDRDG